MPITGLIVSWCPDKWTICDPCKVCTYRSPGSAGSITPVNPYNQRQAVTYTSYSKKCTPNGILHLIDLGSSQYGMNSRFIPLASFRYQRETPPYDFYNVTLPALAVWTNEFPRPVGDLHISTNWLSDITLNLKFNGSPPLIFHQPVPKNADGTLAWTYTDWPAYYSGTDYKPVTGGVGGADIPIWLMNDPTATIATTVSGGVVDDTTGTITPIPNLNASGSGRIRVPLIGVPS